MSRADIGIYGEELYEQVLPLHGPDPDGLAHDYIGALTSQAIEIDDLARDDAQGRPGWGAILYIDDCPIKGLPWLAQIAGVSLRDPRVVTTRRNLVTNGDFAAGTDTGWTVTGAAKLVTAYDFGGYYIYVGRVGSGASRLEQGPIAVYAGKTYTFAVDVVEAQINARPFVRWFNGASALISQTSGAYSIAHGRRVMAVVAPANAVTAWVGVELAVVAGAVGVDTLVFEAGITDGSWFESPIQHLETDAEWAIYARDAIRRQGGRGRGTADAILSAVEDTLIGTQTGRILERVGGNAYALELVTRPSETPDPAATLTAAMAQKPAGMSLTHTLTEGVIINEGTRTIDTSTATIDTATLGDVT
jgi:hypothetical protein